MDHVDYPRWGRQQRQEHAHDSSLDLSTPTLQEFPSTVILEPLKSSYVSPVDIAIDCLNKILLQLFQLVFFF